MQNVANSIRHLRTILDNGDVRAAVIYLNSLTDHRFTSIYRFDNSELRNLYFYDRENPEQHSTPDIPVMASYCVFVRSQRDTFTISNASSDERLDGHPKQQSVQSYCGVPLMDVDGRMYGTICHFDLRTIPISASTVELMESVSRFLRPAII
jgi:GAF domain-containing protein